MQVAMYKIIKFELWLFAVQLFYRFAVFSVKSLILSQTNQKARSNSLYTYDYNDNKKYNILLCSLYSGT